MKTTKGKSLKQLKAGAFGRGLRNWITRKQRDAMQTRKAKAEEKASGN